MIGVPPLDARRVACVETVLPARRPSRPTLPVLPLLPVLPQLPLLPLLPVPVPVPGPVGAGVVGAGVGAAIAGAAILPGWTWEAFRGFIYQSFSSLIEEHREQIEQFT